MVGLYYLPFGQPVFRLPVCLLSGMGRPGDTAPAAVTPPHGPGFSHAGHGARLMDPNPRSRAPVPASGRVFRNADTPTPQTAQSVLISGAAGNLG